MFDNLDPATMTIINTSMANGYYVDSDTGKREVFTFPVFVVCEMFDDEIPTSVEILSIWSSDYLAHQEVNRLQDEHEKTARANGYKHTWRQFYADEWQMNKS